MKIFIFVLCFTAFVCGVAKADIESSSDKDNVTTTSGNVTLPNKDVNVTDANVGEDKEEEEEAESKVEEADEGQLEARDTTLNLNHTSSSNTTDVDDDEDKSNANVTAKETHDESDKTEKRHAVYNVYYTGAGQSQQLQQQQTTTPHSIYSYVDFRQSRRYADTIPGVEGRDYPIFATVPPTSFSCAGRSIGLYGDVEARCQVWHNCQLDGRRDAFLCPNGTLFNQQVLVCDWWYNVECETTPSYYGINTQLVQQSSVGRQASYQGYRQQVNRYQDAAGTTGYYYNYQKPFYVQTTAYPTSYYFDTGSGAAYSGARSAASSSSAAAAAGSSFVATNNLYGGNGAGYYYRPSYQRVEGGGNVGLGGYGYTVSTHTPGYVTMRYDIPGGHYSSNSAASAGSSSGGGFQYQYSTGQLPSSLAVPTVTGSLNTGSRVQYSQRVSGGDRPDHPNYNEKSGYNYRPPQIPIPTQVRPPQPVAPPTTTTTQIYSVTDTKLVQPKISIPIQPIRVATQSYNVVDHPNANEKSGYVRPQVSVPAPTAPRASQAFNYEFSTYGANQNAQIPVVRQPAPVAPTGTGYSYSTYNKVSESVHPNANEKSGYVQPNVRPTQGGGSQTTNYAFSTYESNRNVQIPTIKQTPLATVVTTSHGQSSAAAGQSSTYSHSSYNAGVELVHPNANEKSGYAQTSGGSQRGGSQTTNYAFSTYNSNGNVQYPVIKAKPIPVSTGGQSTYSFSTYNAGVDHPNANEKSAFTSPPVIPVTQPPLRVTQPPIRVTQPPIRVPKPTIRVTHDPIDHPNYNEKSGYNQRPIPVGPQYPPGIFVPKVVISPPDVQVDCTGAYTCRPASPSVQVQPDYETAHVNFGQRVEATVSGGSGSGSVAASDRSAGAVQQQDNGGYY